MSLKENERGRLIPVTLWNKYHIYPTIPGLRHLIFTCPKGFEKVVKKVNGRVLIDENAWFNFVEEENSRSK